LRLDLLESVGRYEIIGELGAGAMSKVFLAHDPNLDRKLALKVLLRTWSLDPGEKIELEKRFLLEARAVGKLSHPNIVRVFDADTDPRTGIPYIAMEWIQGGSLASLLTSTGGLSGPHILKLLAQVASALDYAHQFGRIHRDIKPSNILLSTDGIAKVSDFGVAKIVSETHTISGQVLGTPAYMSPEQVRDEPLDGRSDLFSLGAVLYQCVSGQTPFSGESLVQIVYKILNVDPRPLELPRTEAWLLLKEVVDRALQKEPTRRYESGSQFGEFIDAARLALEQEEDQMFRRLDRDSVADGARTVRFPTPEAQGPVRRSPSGATETVRLSETEIGRAVTSDSPSMGSPPAKGISSTTTVLPTTQKRHRWSVGASALLLAVAASLVAAIRMGRDPIDVERTTTPNPPAIRAATYSSADVSNLDLNLPDAPPGFDTRQPSPAGPHSTIPPNSASEDATGDEPISILPPSALSRTGGPAVENPRASKPKLDVLTPVTIMYRHKGGDANLQVFLDGVRIWNQRLQAAEGRKQKLFGYDSKAIVSIPSGEHALTLRLTDPARSIDASDTVVSRYTNGRKRSLRINLDSSDNEIRLRWKE